MDRLREMSVLASQVDPTFASAAVPACSYLVVGTVRNCARHLRNDVQRVRNALSGARRLQWLLIESDSSDATCEVLGQISSALDSFRFETLGSLAESIPKRTQRIAHCRNRYLDEVVRSGRYDDVDYVIVIDFDGMNMLLTARGIASCWSRDDWGAVTANQAGPYYDIWALRHPHWSPNDWVAQFKFLRRYAPSEEQAYRASLLTRMITIPPHDAWIEVESAFGGLAIYKRELLAQARYVGLDDDGEEVCEHVGLNAAVRKAGGRIFINPLLINTGHTDHSSELRWHARLHRAARRVGRLVLNAVSSR